ncbi:MAG: hypothetical protein KQI62_03450 [Deltaproteobacteria bacterium]|nr:hypothetical protein [Deltaproteobacteria bacterium]
MPASSSTIKAEQAAVKRGPAKGWEALRRWAMSSPGPGLERWIYLGLFALLVAVRLPRILLEGRFWAEEGCVFFARAWHAPWMEALFFSYAGYLNLTANGAGLLAHYLVPLWAAPYVSTGIALIIQCLPAMLILTSRLEWLRHRAVLMVALLIIATPPHSEEVWLNSICSQYHLALSTGIILALEPRGGLMGLLRLGVLLLATLSSPMSWVLAPLFVLRAALERSGPRIWQALVLSAGVVIQVIWFYAPIPGREVGIAPSLFGAIVMVKQAIIPLIPAPLDSQLIKWVSSGFSPAGGPLWPLAVVALLFALLAWGALRHAKESPLWLLLAGAIIATGAYAGSLGDKIGLLHTLGGNRYAFAPQALFGLCVLGLAMLLRGRGRLLARVVVIWLLVVGLWGYWAPVGSGQVQDGPPWPPEAQKWQQDHNYRMKIWPFGWSMQLQGASGGGR